MNIIPSKKAIKNGIKYLTLKPYFMLSLNRCGIVVRISKVKTI